MSGLRDARPGWPRRRAHVGSAAPGRGWVAWLRPEIGQLPDAVTGALPRAWEGLGTGLGSWRNSVHSYLAQYLTAEQARQCAAQAQRPGLADDRQQAGTHAA